MSTLYLICVVGLILVSFISKLCGLYIGVNKVLTWDEAEQYCRTNYSGHLATIRNSAENTEVYNQCIHNDCLIGLRRSCRTSNEIANSSGPWYWQDGYDYGVTYTNWNSGEPNNKNSPECCARIYGTLAADGQGTWNDDVCENFGTTYPFPIFVCEYYPTSTPTHQPTINPTLNPTNKPTNSPSNDPTHQPTKMRTDSPTTEPTINHTVSPTDDPTTEPTYEPINTPTSSPINNPTYSPSFSPSFIPSYLPTQYSIDMTRSITSASISTTAHSKDSIYISIIICLSIITLFLIIMVLCKKCWRKQQMKDHLEYIPLQDVDKNRQLGEMSLSMHMAYKLRSSTIEKQENEKQHSVQTAVNGEYMGKRNDLNDENCDDSVHAKKVSVEFHIQVTDK